MEDAETPTETPLVTPTAEAEAPRTEAATSEEAAAPAQEPSPAAAAAETQLEKEPEPPDPYDELEHERFKPVLERRDQRKAEAIRQEFQAQLAKDTKDWQSTQAYEQIAGVYGTILEKLGEGDTETVGKLVGRLEQAMEPFSTPYKDGIKAEGSSEAAQQLYGAVRGSLDPRGQDELQDYLIATRNASWGDILKKRDEIREGKANKTSADETTSLKAQIEDLKAKARPDGPDTTPKGGSDGRSDDEILLDPSTPVEKLIEIQARQEAG